MAHRGPDGLSIYPDARAGLGLCLLDTGCNGMAVDQDGFCIAFDGRIDNRAALVSALSHGGGESAFALGQRPDKDILLLAYRRFGTLLPGMLAGDFAMGIWDPERAELLLARDRLGVRPLFHCRLAGNVYFASEIKSLRQMAGAESFPVNDRLAGDFVDHAEAALPPEWTFYQGVERLLPGHWMRIGAQGVELACYWALDPPLPQPCADVPARLRDLIVAALNNRLRTNAPVGAMLSGGLDSSTIVSLIGAGETSADPQAVALYAMVFPGAAYGDETSYIDAVTGQYGLQCSRIASQEVGAFDDLDAMIAEQDQPPSGPMGCTFRRFQRAIARDGRARVVLHGHGGDEVISYGAAWLLELAEEGRFVRLWRELDQSRDVLGPAVPLFRRLLRTHGLRRWFRRPRHQGGQRDVVRYAAGNHRRPLGQAQHLSQILASNFSLALEAIDHEAAAAGIEMRMPFVDVDLIMFCLSVPSQNKWAHGLPRAMLRKALHDVLPPAVIQRKDKFDFSDHVRSTMVRDGQPLVKEALSASSSGGIGKYAELDGLCRAWSELCGRSVLENDSLSRIWRAVALSRWLQREAAKPVARREMATQ